jgi:hypothetical protein
MPVIDLDTRLDAWSRVPGASRHRGRIDGVHSARRAETGVHKQMEPKLIQAGSKGRYDGGRHSQRATRETTDYIWLRVSQFMHDVMLPDLVHEVVGVGHERAQIGSAEHHVVVHAHLPIC